MTVGLYPSERAAWRRGHPDGHQCYSKQQPTSDPCPCLCVGCRPDLTDDEIRAIHDRLEPMANALFLVAIMHLAEEAMSA